MTRTMMILMRKFGQVVLVVLGLSFLGVSATAQTDVKDILVGSRLAAGFDIGTSSSEKQDDWAERQEGHFRMAYPAGQKWGVVFVLVSRLKPGEPNPSQDFSAYQTLSVDLKGEEGTESVQIGVKTNTQPDDGSETKLPVKLSSEWKTYEFPLSKFEGTDLKNLFVVAEFLFAGPNPQTVYFRDIKYLARSPKPAAD